MALGCLFGRSDRDWVDQQRRRHPVAHILDRVRLAERVRRVRRRGGARLLADQVRGARGPLPAALPRGRARLPPLRARHLAASGRACEGESGIDRAHQTQKSRSLQNRMLPQPAAPAADQAAAPAPPAATWVALAIWWTRCAGSFYFVLSFTANTNLCVTSKRFFSISFEQYRWTTLKTNYLSDNKKPYGIQLYVSMFYQLIFHWKDLPEGFPWGKLLTYGRTGYDAKSAIDQN